MKKLIQEFKKFIARGNVIDMAVGVIVGSAFTAIVNSLVNDLFLPFVSLFTGGLEFESWSLPLRDGPDAPVLKYGQFIAAVVNFILIAFLIFLFVKMVNRLREAALADVEKEPTEKTCPFCRTKIASKATRCPHCTSMLAEEEPAAESTPDKPAPGA